MSSTPVVVTPPAPLAYTPVPLRNSKLSVGMVPVGLSAASLTAVSGLSSSTPSGPAAPWSRAFAAFRFPAMVWVPVMESCVP